MLTCLEMDDILSDVGSSEGDAPIEAILQSRYDTLTTEMRSRAESAQTQLNQIVRTADCSKDCSNSVRSIKQFKNKIKNAKKVAGLYDEIIKLLSDCAQPEPTRQVIHPFDRKTAVTCPGSRFGR